jgi:NADH:ubiquinone reductase (H+-translocating)
MAARPRVVIIGAGFGGLFAARKLAKQPVDVLLIDRNNYHTFTPLLYQVATSALDASEVAYPIRTIFRGKSNIQFLLGSVTHIDTDARTVIVEREGKSRHETYDYLLVAGGSRPNYFGNEAIQEHAFELASIMDALRMRDHVLQLFERAAWENDFSQRDALTTIVVVGGGPTGLETAGAIYELYNHVLKKEYRSAHMRARVILIEMQPHLLAPYPENLQRAALDQLRSLGVEVMLGRRVVDVTDNSVQLDDGTIIPTHTFVWSAGIQASSLAEMLNVPLERGGRVPVESTMQVKGLERVFAVGDIAYLIDEKEGHPFAQVIPVAQQQGVLAARNILKQAAGKSLDNFSYFERGIMATIGRRRAVAWIFKKIPLTGFIAWAAWLGLHIVTLMGFRNRATVFIRWVWNYITYDRSVRIILNIPRLGNRHTQLQEEALELEPEIFA